MLNIKYDKLFIQINEEVWIQLAPEDGVTEHLLVVLEFGHGNLFQGVGVVFVYIQRIQYILN